VDGAERADLLIRPRGVAPAKLATTQLDTVTSQVATEHGDHHCAHHQNGQNADDHHGRAPSSVRHPVIVC
jgi:hypothetical protein